MTTISWAELLKNRVGIPSVMNSGHMMECIRQVKEKFPTAHIEDSDPGKTWVVVADGENVSNPHNSHYACWAETVELIHVADH